MFEESDVIFRYTREQALEDGVLVNLTPWARLVGFKIPVACTSELWHTLIEAPDHETSHAQAVALLMRVRTEAEQGPDTDRIDFTQERNGETIGAYALCHGGDHAEPVITIMMPWED